MKMTKVTAIACVASIFISGPALAIGQSSDGNMQRLRNLANEGNIQIAATCFKTGEQTSGMNKICYYDCLGSAAAITISSIQLCPLSINN